MTHIVCNVTKCPAQPAPWHRRGFDPLARPLRERAAHKPRSPLNATYPDACMGFNDNKPVITSFNVKSLPVRFVIEAKVDHNGWFADCEGTGDRGLIQGIVAALSHGRTLAGYRNTDTGDHVLYCDEVFTGDDAHRMADEHARVIAEQEQEHDAKFRAMCHAEGLVESHTTDAQDAIAARNTSPRNRQWARDAIDNLRTSREELKRATQEYEG